MHFTESNFSIKKFRELTIENRGLLSREGRGKEVLRVWRGRNRAFVK